MRKNVVVDVTTSDRARLETIIADRNSPQKRVWRALIILLTAADLGTVEITRRTGKSKNCVWRWQERFMEDGGRRDRRSNLSERDRLLTLYRDCLAGRHHVAAPADVGRTQRHLGQREDAVKHFYVTARWSLGQRPAGSRIEVARSPANRPPFGGVIPEN